MGSSQSSTSTGAASTVPDSPEIATAKNTERIRNNRAAADEAAARNLSGIDLVNYKCRRKEKAYKQCVNQHYKDNFLGLSGKTLNQEDECGDLFDAYRKCYLKGMRIEVWDKTAGAAPKQGSLLAKFAAEEQEELEQQQQQQDD